MNARDERGAAATEFALVAPFFLMMVFLVLDGGRLLFTRQALLEVAAEAARCAALKPAGCTSASEVQSWTVTRAAARARLTLTADQVAVAMSDTCNGQAGMARATLALPTPRSAMRLLPQAAVPATISASACFPVPAAS